ncbi:hypothetical protein J3Q64DRAFT_1818376 [Phycomyces blakesleeanus]|uniref:MARVEL domain-containing protein n=1 Tax=Phycomyces blakesleeanus TaxID=4837 RepID=A0ABR3BII6_PHYBL
MGSIVRFVNLLRLSTFITSLVALGFHTSQCMLLSMYQEKANIPSWLESGHWQYLTWFIFLSFSFLSATAVCMHAFCCGRADIFRGDRTLGLTNGVPLVGMIMAATFVDTQEPWTNNTIEFKYPSRGFITYCYTLDAEHDMYYPLLYQRCLLLNGTYVAGAFLSVLWITLSLTSVLARTKRPQQIASLPMSRRHISDSIYSHTTEATTACSKPNTQYLQSHYSTLSQQQQQQQRQQDIYNNSHPIAAYENYQSNQIHEDISSHSTSPSYYYPHHPPLAAHGEKIELSSHHNYHYDEYYEPNYQSSSHPQHQQQQQQQQQYTNHNHNHYNENNQSTSVATEQQWNNLSGIRTIEPNEECYQYGQRASDGYRYSRGQDPSHRGSCYHP